MDPTTPKVSRVCSVMLEDRQEGAPTSSASPLCAPKKTRRGPNWRREQREAAAAEINGQWMEAVRTRQSSLTQSVLAPSQVLSSARHETPLSSRANDAPALRQTSLLAYCGGSGARHKRRRSTDDSEEDDPHLNMFRAQKAARRRGRRRAILPDETGILNVVAVLKTPSREEIEYRDDDKDESGRATENERPRVTPELCRLATRLTTVNLSSARSRLDLGTLVEAGDCDPNETNMAAPDDNDDDNDDDDDEAFVPLSDSPFSHHHPTASIINMSPLLLQGQHTPSSHDSTTSFDAVATSGEEPSLDSPPPDSFVNAVAMSRIALPFE